MQALLQLNLGLPVVQVFACAADVGLTLGRVVSRQGQVNEFGCAAGQFDHFFGQLANGEFTRVAKVDGARKAWCTVVTCGYVHEAHKAFDQVVYIAKAACLLARAVERDVLPFKRLHNEVAHHTAVVGVHARAVGVEYAGHTNVKLVLAMVVKKQGFGATLAFVVAAANANRVDIAPVVFCLWMHSWVAIHLTGAGLKNAGLKTFGQAQHVDGTVHAGLEGLNRVVLVVDGTGGASQVVNLVHFHVQRKRHVVAHELKARVVEQMLDVALGTGEQVVGTDDFVATGQQAVNQVAAQKASTAGDQNAFAGVVVAHVFLALVVAKQVAGVDLVGHIADAMGHAVGHNDIGLGLELRQVGDDAAVEESVFFERGFEDDDFDAFGLDAFHDALNAAGPEVVGTGFHDQAVDADDGGVWGESRRGRRSYIGGVCG